MMSSVFEPQTEPYAWSLVGIDADGIKRRYELRSADCAKRHKEQNMAGGGWLECNLIPLYTDDKHLLCRITHLEDALENLISVACRCDGWESFPQGALDDAEGVLNDG